MARPKGNRPPYTKVVRISDECRRLLSYYKFGNKEPMGNVVERAIRELQKTKADNVMLQKKAEALGQELIDHAADNPMLLTVIKERYKL
jgi:hypothetical protein